MSYWLRSHPYVLTCQACTRRFEAQRRDARACSDTCRRRLARGSYVGQRTMDAAARLPVLTLSERAGPAAKRDRLQGVPDRGRGRLRSGTDTSTHRGLKPGTGNTPPGTVIEPHK